MKNFLITQSEIAQLADAIALLDWIKNRLPDESPDKSEAEAKAISCHALLEGLLGDDSPAVYSPAEPEELHA